MGFSYINNKRSRHCTAFNSNGLILIEIYKVAVNNKYSTAGISTSPENPYEIQSRYIKVNDNILYKDAIKRNSTIYVKIHIC
jgi:hypothetical protein